MNSVAARGGPIPNVNLRLGIVTARFNAEITGELEKGAMTKLRQLGVSPDRIVAVYVPGAFEIPLAAQALFEYQNVDAVIALGAVIRGETTHYDYVCQAVERGCSQLALKVGKPVVFGVLTTENDEQAQERIGGRHGHKGEDAAVTAIEMCNLLKALQNRGGTLDAESQAGYTLGLSKEVSP